MLPLGDFVEWVGPRADLFLWKPEIIRVAEQSPLTDLEIFSAMMGGSSYYRLFHTGSSRCVLQRIHSVQHPAC